MSGHSNSVEGVAEACSPAPTERRLVMSDQDAFDRILASLYQAMLDDTQWPAASALIDEACGMQGNALVVTEGPEDDIRTLFVGLYYRGLRHEDWERSWLETYLPTDECVPRFRQLPDSRVAHAGELYTPEELKTSLAYNEGLPRTNFQDGLRVRLDGLDGTTIAWATADPVSPNGWEFSQLAMVRGLLPHIRQFVHVQQSLVKAGALGPSLDDLLDNSRLGVIHLDRRGQIMAVNDRARHILRHGDGLSDRNGLLCARLPEDHVRLGRLLADALPTSGAAAVSGSMLLHRATVPLPFVLHVTPALVPQPDFGVRHVAALVLIVEPGKASRIDPTLVAATLGLTPVESRIAAWLAEGKTVQDIATATGRKEDSVYWNMKQIYHKCGISRQVDLVRLVLSLTTFA